ncbi:MAG: ATP-binding protein, partial [Acidobacteria bacterium]|nr:ATP-binding protein [Acidobacteriota bacterium]
MEIRRDRLATEFAKFERQGNGVVLGAPGVGKTHLLVTHFRAAHADHRPAYLLSLDKHSVHNDLELQTELGLDRDLIDTLRDDVRATPAAPGLLIIDSYDSLRSEDAQKYVRTLIRRAQNVLQASWRIIVAVRTFDALRSEMLLAMFPPGAPPAPEFQMRGVLCRHFVVPALSDDETLQAVASIPGLDRIFERSSPEFRWLLRTPFNLWLAEKLLGGGVNPDTLSDVSSEVQLLSLFWHQRVASGLMALRRRSVLTELARAMVEAHQLSVRFDAAYKREDDEVWRDLFSAEILTQVGTAGQRVAFAHNILFDFAVSVLLIEDEPAQVAEFLAAEPARPVFLRPSINYYFTRLWAENRGAFWAVSWFLLTSEQVHLRLFGRLIPMAVVVREAVTVDDLDPVFRALAAKEAQAP